MHEVSGIELDPQLQRFRRLRLDLAYDGTDFHGWQEQAGERSVAGEVKQALERLLKHPIKLIGAGRTDAGVHALGQVAHADTPTTSPRPESIQAGLNSLLPSAIRVWGVREVEADFHARYGARLKEYRYQIWDGPWLPPFLARYDWRSRQGLDAAAMARAASGLDGTHDFTSFLAAGCVATSPVRTLEDASVARHGSLLVLRLASRGFLRHMVRNVAGALIEVGRGRLDASRLTALLAARNRAQAPATAQAQGLFLVAVSYHDGPLSALERPPEPVVTFGETTFGVS
jgi:tRNA pseudouridine38-40 synthase